MRLSQASSLLRMTARALVLAALPIATASHSALAQDALIPQAGSEGIEPVLQQTGLAAPGPVSNELVPAAQFVEDPTRQAGGEDDAQRANDRLNERQTEQSDDDRRRK